MSYILDALRRADAERERGAVPGIHAQPAALGEVDSETRGPSRRGVWVGVGLGGLLSLAAFVWFVLRGSDASRPGGDVNAVATPPTNPLPVTPAAVVAAPVVAPAAPPPQAVVAAPAAVIAAPLVLPAEAPPVARKPVHKVAAAAAPKPATPAAKPVAKAVAAAASMPVATEPRLYLLSELPDDIRRELPALAIGGAMYSQNPANRLLIVNGQTFHEGDKLSPNLTLEQIKLKSAVLDYKGYRYAITY